MLNKRERMVLLRKAYTTAQANGTIRKVTVKDGHIINSSGFTQDDLDRYSSGLCSNSAANGVAYVEHEQAECSTKGRGKGNVRKPKRKPRRGRTSGSTAPDVPLKLLESIGTHSIGSIPFHIS